MFWEHLIFSLGLVYTRYGRVGWYEKGISVLSFKMHGKTKLFGMNQVLPFLVSSLRSPSFTSVCEKSPGGISENKTATDEEADEDETSETYTGLEIIRVKNIISWFCPRLEAQQGTDRTAAARVA